MSHTCINAIISGKVQGVFYRDSTRQQAQQLNLTGWVKNLPSGEVELMACGEKTNIEKLITWLWQGPPAASVTNVTTKTVSTQHFSDFTVTY